MRLHSFGIRNYGPLKLIEVSDLADNIVFAGPNGVGKTHINKGLLELGRNPQSLSDLWLVVNATSAAERTAWGKASLNTREPGDAKILRRVLQRNHKRNSYQSSFLNFDSDRAVRNIQHYQFQWDIGDPFAEEVAWEHGFGELSNRYNDVRHSLFRMVENQKREIADKAFAMRDAGDGNMLLNFPDVLKPFKDAFWQLLAPKKMIEVSTRDQQIYYENEEGKRLSTELLSSGEREVINIAFDFLLRGPKDCIVLFDEPELHLHPELSYKLLQTLSTIGARNQFLFSTHSPEIISASLENTVVFVKPPSGPDQNQAVPVHRDDDTHQALQTLGQSIGVISLGKKLVLIEGEEASLDKQTYGAILKNKFPEFILVPVGGKDMIRSFADVRDKILNRTIWGVEFYLLCDRDAANLLGLGSEASVQGSRVCLLPRYHIENYFLDQEVIAACFSEMEEPTSWLCQPVEIEQELLKIAGSTVSYAAALAVTATFRERVGNVSVMPKGVADANSADTVVELMLGKLRSEVGRVRAGLDEELLVTTIRAEYERLANAVAKNLPVWRSDLPGRPILNKLAAKAKIQPGRLKQLYLSKSNQNIAFAEIVKIFEAFRTMGLAGGATSAS